LFWALPWDAGKPEENQTGIRWTQRLPCFGDGEFISVNDFLGCFFSPTNTATGKPKGTSYDVHSSSLGDVVLRLGGHALQFIEAGLNWELSFLIGCIQEFSFIRRWLWQPPDSNLNLFQEYFVSVNILSLVNVLRWRLGSHALQFNEAGHNLRTVFSNRMFSKDFVHP
jgi:hypothetical protein